MSAFYPVQTAFNKGEISPLLATRADIDFWRQSLDYCLNFHVLTHGGIRRRSGSRYVATLKNSAVAGRLLPFKFSEAQAYVLVLNDGFIRFCALRGVLGAPYQIAHAWAAGDLPRLAYTQVNDVAYVAHKGYAPQKLVRAADTSWSIGAATFNDGPYLDANTTATTLTPSDYGSFVPKMTTLTAPSGTVSSEFATADAWELFDKNSKTSSTLAAGSGAWVQYRLAAAAQKVCDAYWLQAPASAGTAADMPSQWRIQGSNNGATWITIDSRDGEVGWQASERRFYSFNNKAAFEYLRFECEGGGGADAANTNMAEWAPNEAGDMQTPFNLTASALTGINGGAGFQATDVGRSIRLLGSDNQWRWARIAARTSTTVVTVRIYGQSLPDLDPIINWRLGAFSTQSGQPGAVALYNERVTWARTDAEPVAVYGSKQGQFEEYGISSPAVTTDGLKINLLSSNMNEILWISDDEDLITGSAGQIRSVGPSDLTQSFSATNLTQRKGPTSGASSLKPLSIGGVTLYVGQGNTKIRELVLSDQNRYVAPELTVLAEHMFKAGIVDWAFAEKPDPIIWCVIGDGTMVSITYDREQKVLGFARHNFGGIVESLAVIPGPVSGNDDVYLIVRRTINGTSRRYIEVMERPFDGDVDAVEDAFFVDCGVTYDGAPITTVTGLSHLEGMQVLVLADGGVVRGLTVASGAITLPVAASVIHVGLEFTSKAVTLPIAGPGQDGTLFGRRKSVVAGHVDTLHTGALSVGASGSARWTPPITEQIMHTGDTVFGNSADLVTGFTRCDIEGSWAEGDGKVIMQTSDPLPCLIRSFVFQVESEP